VFHEWESRTRLLGAAVVGLSSLLVASAALAFVSPARSKKSRGAKPAA